MDYCKHKTQVVLAIVLLPILQYAGSARGSFSRSVKKSQDKVGPNAPSLKSNSIKQSIWWQYIILLLMMVSGITGNRMIFPSLRRSLLSKIEHTQKENLMSSGSGLHNKDICRNRSFKKKKKPGDFKTSLKNGLSGRTLIRSDVKSSGPGWRRRGHFNPRFTWCLWLNWPLLCFSFFFRTSLGVLTLQVPWRGVECLFGGP